MSYLEMLMLSYLKNERGNEDSLGLSNQSFKRRRELVIKSHPTSSLICTSQNTLEDEEDEPLLKESNLIF